MKKIIFLLLAAIVFIVSCDKKTDNKSSQACKTEYTTWCFDNDVWMFNLCGEKIGIVIECGENEKCETDKCEHCEVTSSCARKDCSDGNVYCYNNCGKKENIFKECTEGTACSEGDCVDCDPTDICLEKKCFEGDVYCYTDCGNRGELDEVCAQTENCEEGKCVGCDVTEECETKKCEGQEVYCYNNCGKRGELSVECEDFETCADGKCNCTPDCKNKECGQDGCGGDCGECSGSDGCIDGKCGSKVDLTGPTYSGDVLLIVNTGTNGSQTSFTGTIPASILKDEIISEADFSLNIGFFDPGVQIPQGLDRAKVIKPEQRISLNPASPAVGTVESFVVADFGSGGDRTVSATLQYVGSKCEVWAEDINSTGKTKAEQLCNEFDNVIYSMVTTNFYSESDINDDGKIAFLVANLGGFAAGYFSPGDFYPKDQYSSSNERDIIYVEKAMEVSQITNTMAHEFQHLCFANRNFLEESDSSYGDLSQRWIDEGLATASEHFYSGSQSDLIQIYNTKPYNDPVADGNGFFKWDYSDNDRVYSDYALAYAFFQYFRLQSKNQNGMFTEIIENNNNDWTGVAEVIKNRVDSNMSFGDFMVNFRIAMLLNLTSGMYGYKNETALKFYPRYYTGTGKNLEGGGALYIKINGSFTEPEDKGSNIVYVGITTK